MPKDAPPPLSLALTVLREAAGWSQKELAAAAAVSTGQLSLHEQGKKPLRRELLEAFAKAMDFLVEAVDFAVLAATVLRSPGAGEAPPSPSHPSAAERRIADRTAGLLAGAAIALTKEAILGRIRARRVAQAEADAERQWKKLQGCTPAERRLLVERSVEYRNWALGARLGEESARAAAQSGAAALELARLAVRSAELTEGDDLWRRRLEGRARGFLANALRVDGKLRAAGAEIARARQLWEAGAAGDPCRILPEWRLPDLEASLRRDLRQFEAALELLDQAHAAAPPEAIGRILLKRAFTLEQAGDNPGAAAALSEAAPLIEAGGERRQIFAVAFNLTVNLVHCRRFDEAMGRLADLRRLAASLGNKTDATKVLWLSGRIAHGLGRQGEARAAFERARDDFAARQQGLQTAMVSLELAVLHLEEGRTAEVQALAGAMAWVFRTGGIEREALAALRLFCKAAHEERVTLEGARSLVAVLEKAARRCSNHRS
jgi:transcriptional regulator with XRE-family HTH domain